MQVLCNLDGVSDIFETCRLDIIVSSLPRSRTQHKALSRSLCPYFLPLNSDTHSLLKRARSRFLEQVRLQD